MGATPEPIKQAKIEGNISYLKAAGKKGGFATAAKRREVKATDEVLRRHLAELPRSDDMEWRDGTFFPIDIHE